MLGFWGQGHPATLVSSIIIYYIVLWYTIIYLNLLCILRYITTYYQERKHADFDASVARLFPHSRTDSQRLIPICLHVFAASLESAKKQKSRPCCICASPMALQIPSFITEPRKRAPSYSLISPIIHPSNPSLERLVNF